MPVRIPLITDPAARVLLDGVIDYAGLFPPAALNVADAVRAFAKYRGGEAGWMLGRFICPVAQFDAFGAVAEPLLPRDAGAIPWRLTAIGTGDHAADASEIVRINDCHRWSWDECSAVVDTVETRAASPDDVAVIHAAFTAESTVFVEVPINGDPRPFIDALARTGRSAKMRTGGVHADAFPRASQVAAFIDACVEAGVAFKATAGLHHALHGTYPLTGAADSAQAPMFGFLNLLLACALRLDNAAPDECEAALLESDRTSVVFTDEAIVWRGRRFDRTRLAHLREHVMISFGSCSFTEPVSEVRAMGAW
jgi:hypothetical protein